MHFANCVTGFSASIEGAAMCLGQKDRTPYEIESEKEDAPAHPEPVPMRHEPRRDTILRAPIRLAGPGAEPAKDATSPPRRSS